jgi:hypothetical protein
MLTVQKAGATPNLLKYRVSADHEGGVLTLSQETLLRDTAPGPLRTFIERAVGLADDDDACMRLLCNPQTRVFVTPRALARLAVDAVAESPGATIGLKVIAEPDASGIVALEFRHSMSA